VAVETLAYQSAAAWRPGVWRYVGLLVVAVVLAGVWGGVAWWAGGWADELVADRELALAPDRPGRVEAGTLTDEQRGWLIDLLDGRHSMSAEMRAFLDEALADMPLPLDERALDSPAALAGQTMHWMDELPMHSSRQRSQLGFAWVTERGWIWVSLAKPMTVLADNKVGQTMVASQQRSEQAAKSGSGDGTVFLYVSTPIYIVMRSEDPARRKQHDGYEPASWFVIGSAGLATVLCGGLAVAWGWMVVAVARRLAGRAARVERRAAHWQVGLTVGLAAAVGVVILSPAVGRLAHDAERWQAAWVGALALMSLLVSGVVWRATRGEGR
jgi:hypothetical protein